MKLELSWDSESYENVSDVILALRARDWRSAMYQLDQSLRSEIKYNNRYELQPARDMLHKILDELQLDILD